MHGPQNFKKKKKLGLFYNTSRSICWKLLQGTFKTKCSIFDDYENSYNDDDDGGGDDDDNDNDNNNNIQVN